MRIRVIGCGNPMRSDDGLGIEAARRVEALGLAGVEVRVSGQPGSDLLDLMDGADGVILLDAVSTGAPPGTLHAFTREAFPPAGVSPASTHGLGVAQALALGEALGRLPARWVFLGIEAERFEPGSGLSPRVRAALPLLVDRVRETACRWRKEGV